MDRSSTAEWTTSIGRHDSTAGCRGTRSVARKIQRVRNTSFSIRGTVNRTANRGRWSTRARWTWISRPTTSRPPTPKPTNPRRVGAQRRASSIKDQPDGWWTRAPCPGTAAPLDHPPSHHCLAFWNILSHGEASRSRRQSGGIHGHCHFRKVRSGWGIITR
jgi:hypothetical protein